MKKNTGSQTIGAQMVSATDGSAFTGSVTAIVTGDAGVQGGGGACTHEGNGYHSYAPSQAETNYNHVAFTFTGTGAVPVTIQVYTVSYDRHDTVRLGLTALPNAAAEASGGLFTRGTGAGQINQNANGQIDANTTHAAGTAWGSGAITAGAIATGAIDSDAFAAGAITATVIADGAIDAATFAAGAITATVLATDCIDNDAIATGAFASSAFASGCITSDAFAAGAINAAAVADGAIDLATFAADAQAIWGVVDSGTAQSATTSQVVLRSAFAASSTSLVGYTIHVYSSTNNKWATGYISAHDNSTDTVTVSPAWAVAPSGTILYIVTATPYVGLIDAIWDEATSGHSTAGTTGKAVADAGAAGDPWTISVPGAYSAGTAGYILGNGVNVASMSANSITSSALTNGCITSAELHSSALAAIADSVWDEPLSDHNTSDTTASGFGVITSGTAQSATSTTIVLASATSFADGILNGATIVITGGTGVGQRALITDWTSSSDTATVDGWVTTPDNTSTYNVFATPPSSAASPVYADVQKINGDATAADVLKLYCDILDQSTGQLDSGSLASGTITAAAIASDAITAAKIADGAIDAATFAAGAITATVIADGAIDAATFAAGAITATVIATDAIDADAVASDAVTEIQSGLATASALSTVSTNVSAILDDTGTSGVIVASIASGAITASAIATDAIDVNEISAAACNKIADHVRRRTQANVEASSYGDTLSVGSEYGLIQQAQESNTVDNAGKLTVYKTDGTTELAQRTITTDGTADPVTGIS